MKNTQFVQRALVTALLTLWAGSGLAEVETETFAGKMVVSGEIDTAVQLTNIDDAREKFEEYREVPNGVVVNDFRLKADGASTAHYLDIRVKDPLQDDERYEIKGGVHGSYNFGIIYDNIPHNFSSGRFLESSAGGGRYVISDAVQSALQANEVLRSARLTNTGVTSTANGALINPADAQNMALDAGMTGIVNNSYTAANTVKFGLNREKTGFSFDYHLPDDAKVWVKLNDEKRTGVRRINAGSYERYNNGVTTTTAGVGNRSHVADYFQVEGIELPESIDYRTTTFNLGTGIYKKDWLLDAAYTLTSFENRNHSLIWDNPFRITGAEATNAAGTAPANAFNRFRSALGQASLPPDSRSHELAVSGALDNLPLNSRFTANVSYGRITQDTDFAPYTLNTGLLASTSTPTGAAAGTLPNTVLPQNSLNGEVATLFQSYQLTSKPTHALTVTGKYRYYDYDNKSDHITFPNYAAFGDSFWRAVRNDPGAPVRNETLSFTRQNAELALDYHWSKALTLQGEGFWEGWDREELRIDGTEEIGFAAGVVYKPSMTTTLRAKYRRSDRTVHGYETGNTRENPEAVGLVNYDWADRERDKFDLRAQMLPTDEITIGASVNYLKDKFAEDARFGLKKNRSLFGDLDISYAPSEEFSIHANYSRENRKGLMQSGAKDDAFDNPATATNETTIGAFNPENYWNTDTKETVDTFGLGAMFHLIPEKLILNVDYALSDSDMEFTTSNPNGSVKLLNAAAQPWPTVKNRWQELKIDLGYNFSASTKIGMTYLYERYELDDFANTGAYMAGSSFENSTKYVFTGANNFNYDAHVLAAYVRFQF